MLVTMKAIRELIQHPGDWVRDYIACDIYGDECSPLDDSAACWCLDGAATFVACHPSRPAYPAVAATLVSAANDAGFMGHVEFNDDPATTHADVMKLLDGVIADLELAS